MLSRGSIPLAVFLALASCLPAAADDDAVGPTHRMEIGVQAGFFLPDDDVSSKDTSIQEMEPTGGPRFAVLFGKHFDWFLDGLVTDVNANTSPVLGPVGDVETRALRTGVHFYLEPHDKKVQWFVGLGGGYIDADIELQPDFDRNFASVSAGQKIRLDDRANFRWEVRVDEIFDDNDILEGYDITRPQLLISVNWGLKRIDKDSDGDGVPDSRDDCPDTPRGAVVDERGCPLDSDGDGVYDGIDRCPDTPRGAVVDEWGCPKDSDGDGVWDGIDRCPDTPRGAVVDEWGCPSDGDGDGVWNGIDECPKTPANTPVRANGCPKEKPLFTPEKKTLVLEGVFFEFDKAILKPVSQKTLDRVAQSLVDWPDARVEVAGHTDHMGPDAYNQDLSQRRAQAVRDYLVKKGVEADRLRVKGYGESKPVADNGTKEGRAKNRRVELKKLN